MSGFAQLRLVIGREISESLRRTSVKILLGVLVVGATVGVIVPEVIGESGDPEYDVYVGDGIAADVAADLPPAGAENDIEITVVGDAEVEAADPRAAVRDGEVEAAVLDGDPPVVVVEDDRSDLLLAVLTNTVSTPSVLDRLEDAGLSAQDATEIVARPGVEIDRLDTDDDSERRGVAYAASLVLYLALLMVTIQVANGTAIEKSSRISEVLLAVVRPATLLFGKVVGVASIALLGVIALVIPVIGKAAVGGSLPPSTLPTIGVALVWFVLGLAVWAPLAGMFGSLVERQEEVGTALQPVTIVLVAAFIVVSSAPESTIAAVLGYVPLTSPIVEPTRIAAGASSPMEVVGSLLLLVVGAGVAIRLGGVVYRRAIVRTGKRLRVRDVW